MSAAIATAAAGQAEPANVESRVMGLGGQLAGGRSRAIGNSRMRMPVAS